MQDGATTGEGRTVRCERCGGVIELTTVVPRASCSFCRHEQIVPPELFAELSRYQTGLDRHAARAQAHDRNEYAARIETISDPFSFGALVVAFAPVVLFGGGNELVKLLGLLPPALQSDVDAIVGAVTGTWLAAGTAGYIWYRRAHALRRVRGHTEGVGSVTCPSCGAPNAFVSGQVIERCGHCAAALMPHAGVIARGLDAARLQERRARLDRCRTERAAAGIVVPPALDGVIQLVVYGLLALMALVAGYFAPILITHGEPTLEPYAQLITLGCWILGVLGSIAGIVLLVLHATKQSNWQVAHASLAVRLGGARADVRSVRRWLDTYWAGPSHVTDLEFSGFGGALTTTVDQFPVLVLVDTVTGRQDRSPRASIFVAAVYPGEPSEVSATLRRSLADQGFRVDNTEAGLRADANDDVLGRLHKSPMDVLALSQVPGKMVGWVKQQGDPAPAG